MPKYVTNTCYVPGIVLEAGDMSVQRVHSRRRDRHKQEKIRIMHPAARMLEQRRAQ